MHRVRPDISGTESGYDADHYDMLTPAHIGWQHDNLVLSTVGVDIGSSTTHIMFGEVHLRRLSQSLSSRYVVVDRRRRWASDILLTPYRPDGDIDAEQLNAFVSRCYADARVDREQIDTGVVILTGEALLRRNARRISSYLADESGRFICALAGHHRESAMAAVGSGATELSRTTGKTVLNIDVGGGTTKLALIAAGEILSTAAIAVGARVVVLDDQRRIVSLAASARDLATQLGLALTTGDVLSSRVERRLIDSMVATVVAHVAGEPPGPLANSLLLTEPLAAWRRPDVVSFSGGVSEFVYGREARGFGDLGQRLGHALRRAADSDAIPFALVEPPHGIRATAAGLTQFSVQVGGSTAHSGHSDVLPLRNMPVVGPVACGPAQDRTVSLADRLRHAMSRADADAAGSDGPVAIALQWAGPPSFVAIREVGDALRICRPPSTGTANTTPPVVVLLDADLAASIGAYLAEEVFPDRPVVCVDTVDLQGCDFVDIGQPVGRANLMPVVMKSMLFL